MKYHFFSIITCIIFITGCCIDYPFRKRVLSVIEKSKSKTVLVKDIFIGEWDEIFIVYGVTCPYEIEQKIKIKFPSNRCVQDNEMIAIYVQNKNVIRIEWICPNVPYIKFNFRKLVKHDTHLKYEERGKSLILNIAK